jgi:hypothetical protein
MTYDEGESYQEQDQQENNNMVRRFAIRPRCDMRNRCNIRGRCDTKDMMRDMQSRWRDVIPEIQHIKCEMRYADQMRQPSELRDDHPAVTDGASPRYYRIRPVQAVKLSVYSSRRWTFISS